MSFGAETSEQSSKSQSTQDRYGYNASATYVDPNQQPFLQSLFGNASNLANDPSGAAAVGNQANANNPFLSDALSGTAALADPTGQIASQEAALQAGLGDLFTNTLNPAITGNAVGAGQLGGGRQGVAQANAVGEIAQAYTQGLGDITGQANLQALQAQGQIPGLTNALLDNQGAGQQFGMDIFAQLAQILGGPTVLSSQFGEDTAQSQSTSSGSGSSAGFDIGFGNMFS